MKASYFCAVFWISSSASVGLAQTLAFEGAEGFGKFAAGARTNLSSASVYHVTNLNDSGTGSFRDAVSAANRFVVFDVGGIINLDSNVVVKNNITIAGQTAPGGIVTFGAKVSYSGASNTITRHMAYRLGRALGREDASGAANGANMMFDHMSITWGVDETLSFNSDGKGTLLNNITVQDSIVGQGLDVVGHSAAGLMTFPENSRFSLIRNLFTDSGTRNPKVRGENEFINNVVYGWTTAGYIMGDTVNMDSHANVINNYMMEGGNDGGSAFASGTPNFHIYGSGNYLDQNRDGVVNGSLVTNYPGADVLATPVDWSNYTETQPTMTAREALDYVAANAGPSIIRDAVDTRLALEVNSHGTLGGMIDRETDLFPGYGTDPKYLNPRARLVDSDNDGIADNWETANGLNPNNGADWKGLNTAGYTKLEEYVNELGARGTARASNGGNWTTKSIWGGTAPSLADEAVVVGNLGVASGNAFARRLTLAGNLGVTGGTVDVFDTAAISDSLSITGGTATFGRLLLGSAGRSATLTLSTGATLQSATIAPNGGTATFDWNGGTVRTTGPGNISLATTLGGSGGTLDTAGFDGVYSGRISGSGRLIKVGAGTLTLSGNNAYAGGTSVAGGLKLASNTAAGTGSISVSSSGGTVLLGNGVTVGNDIVTDHSFEVLDVPDANATATYAGNLTRVNSKQIRLKTTGLNATLNLTGTIAAPNGFFISSGNVAVLGNGSITGSGGAVGRGGATALTLRNNATFNIGGFSIGGGQAVPTGTITVRDTATLSTGSASLDLLSTSSATSVSTLNLDGGTTTVGGLLKTSVGSTQTSVIDFNGGTLKYAGTAPNASFLPVLPGLTANVQAGGARIDDGGQDITIAQPLLHDPSLATVDGGLTKVGGGTLTLTGANTYNGSTKVNAGTLVAAPGTLNNAALDVRRGATVTFNAAGSNASALIGSGAISNGFNGAVVFTGDHSGFGGTVTQNGSGTRSNIQLNSAAAGSVKATYSVSAGELIFAANGDYTVSLGALSSTGGSIRGGNSATGTTTLVVGALGTSTSVAGNLNNGNTKVIGLTKVGPGTLTFAGSNDFGGGTANAGTTLNAGSLVVNGIFSNANNTVTVNGGTLAGSGKITGAVTVNAAGVLAPGNSPGILTTGSVTFASNADFSVELNGPTAGNGASNYDQLSVIGNVSLDGADLLASLAYVPVAGDKLFVLKNDGVDPVMGRFAGLAEGATLSLLSAANQQMYVFQVSYFGNAEANSLGGGNDVALTSVVPEPTALSLLSLAGLVMLRRRRSQHQSPS